MVSEYSHKFPLHHSGYLLNSFFFAVCVCVCVCLLGVFCLFGLFNKSNSNWWKQIKQDHLSWNTYHYMWRLGTTNIETDKSNSKSLTHSFIMQLSKKDVKIRKVLSVCQLIIHSWTQASEFTALGNNLFIQFFLFR